jgi:hypothetical protein
MTAVSDTFTYSNGELATVSSGVWAPVTDLADLDVISGLVTAPGNSTVAQVRHTTALASDDQFCEAEFVNDGTTATYREASVMVRVSSTEATFYRIDWNPASSGELTLYRCNAGTFTEITSATGVGGIDTDPHTIRIEAEGTTIRGFFDDVEEISVTNTSIASGAYVGVGAYHTHTARRARVDSFSGGDLGASAVAVALTPATLTAAAQSLALSLTALATAITPATGTFAAQALTPVRAATVIQLTPATLTAAAQELVLDLEPLATALTPATATIAAQTLSPQAGGAPVAVALTPATITATAQALSPSLAAKEIELTPATLTITASVLVPVIEGVGGGFDDLRIYQVNLVGTW